MLQDKTITTNTPFVLLKHNLKLKNDNGSYNRVVIIMKSEYDLTG